MHNPPVETADTFDEAMKKMASDAAIIDECRSIAREFAAADMDGLKDD
jgi:hypothetical protein